jgi:pyridoxamine 5'-phosphate oxidase
MDANIASIRQDYKKATLSESDASVEPFEQFAKWWQECINAEVVEPNAMSLATINLDGFPDSRIVLLKDYNSQGFTFFTNYESAKGKAIAANNKVQLLFFWPELERQIRITGFADKLTEIESTNYFQSRPKESQIGAWSSRQSTVVANREVLETAYQAFTEQYKDEAILPKPEFWGGYRVTPMAIEFWQGRSNRLHDRLLYSKKDGQWNRERLSP